MDAAFLLVAAKPGRRPARHQLELARCPEVHGLHFQPTDHAFWSDEAGGVAFGCWQNPSDPRAEGGHWEVDEDGIAISTGYAHRAGEAPMAPVDLARRLRASWTSESPLAIRDRLRGIFTAVALDRGGDGTLFTDPLGLSFVYAAETNHAVILSSRAWLAAVAASPPGQRPERDHLGACWLAYNSYRIGDRTGFAGVRLLAPGAVVELNRDTAPSFRRSRAPWVATERLVDLSRAEAIEMVRGEIADALASSLLVPADRTRVDLTGGKDTRLVLAALLSEGLTDDLTFQTIGPPTLPDVLVAKELAERFCLDHIVDFPLVQHEKTYGERIREFVGATGGLTNIWDMKLPQPGTRSVRIMGATGESLRSHQRVGSSLAASNDPLQLFERACRFGRLGLLEPEVETSLREMAREELLGAADPDSPPLDLLDSFFIRNRARHRYGPLEEFEREIRLFPLYSIECIRAAFALGASARQSELLHYEIIHAASEALAEQPFAGPGWPEDRLDDRAQPKLEGKAGPLMARLHGEGFSERRPALVEILADADNPAWELIDRHKAASAIERFPSLDVGARRELYGALTTALWLGTEVAA